jgi:hypothetical protein
MWSQLVATALGLWLMAAPAVLGYGDPARMNDRIVGPIIASFAFIAVWEVTRSLRWVNVLSGLWLIVAPWILDFGTAATVNSIVVALGVLIAASTGGSVSQSFGGGWWAVVAGSDARREQHGVTKP